MFIIKTDQVKKDILENDVCAAQGKACACAGYEGYTYGQMID